MLLNRAEGTWRSRNLVNRVERCACKSGESGPSLRNYVAIVEHKLTTTWKMLSAGEMGTFSKPKLRNLAVMRVLVTFAKAVLLFIVGVYSRECFLTDGAAEDDVDRRKLKAHPPFLVT